MNLQEIKRIYLKYNIKLSNDGTILNQHEIKINKHFEYKNKININFEKYCKVLNINSFTQKLNQFSKDDFLYIVNHVIKNITDKEYTYFTDIYTMNEEDFNNIKCSLQTNEQMNLKR